MPATTRKTQKLKAQRILEFQHSLPCVERKTTNSRCPAIKSAALDCATRPFERTHEPCSRLHLALHSDTSRLAFVTKAMLIRTTPVQETGNHQPKTEPASFAFPPWHQYPPLYTIQPCARTRERQLYLWRRLILDYCEHFWILTLRLYDAESPQMPLFCNRAIQRRLSRSALQCIFQELVLSGDAAWSNPEEKEELLIFWRSPRLWADELLRVVAQYGQNKGGVFTLPELASMLGERCSLGRQQRAQALQTAIPIAFLEHILELLAAQGKARVFSTNEGRGVKFDFS